MHAVTAVWKPFDCKRIKIRSFSEAKMCLQGKAVIVVVIKYSSHFTSVN